MGIMRGDWGFFGVFMDSPLITGAWISGWIMWACALVLYDETSRRLPNAMTYTGGFLAIAVAILYDPSWLWGGALWILLYVVVGAFIGGVGGGDIKLACSLGIIVGSFGVWCVCLSMMCSSIMTVARSVWSRGNAVPHGPSMLLGAVAGVFLCGM